MRALPVALLALLAAACRTETPQTAAPAQPQAAAVPAAATENGVRIVEREIKGEFHTLKLSYPQLSGVPAVLNRQLAEWALIHLEQVEDDPIPFEEYARNFAAENATMRKETPDSQWANESILTLVHRGKTTLTTVCKTYTNIGAAHPSNFVHYENYDPATGARLEFGDLVEPGAADRLRALAAAVNTERGGPELDLTSFAYEPALGFLPDRLLFRFDADARMSPDIEIPYSRLRGLIRARFLP